MKASQFLAQVTSVLEERADQYGPARPAFEHVATRWSLMLGMEISPAQVVLCLIDLKDGAACA